jgi:hypothetical protein
LLVGKRVYLKRRHFVLRCPRTAKELTFFVKRLSLLLSWKHSIIDWTNSMAAGSDK